MGKRDTAALGELRQFLEFLRSLWAMLAGVSVLFPFSNALFKVIPLGRWSEGGFVYLAPELVAALATVACAFVVLATFGRRHEVATGRRRVRRQARRSFFGGVAALLAYLAGHQAVADDFYFRVLGWESGDLRRVAGDLVLLVAYAAFFSLVTRAFMLLGLVEYCGSRGAPPGGAEGRDGR